MHYQEVLGKLEADQTYKFVGTLMPPMIALARENTDPPPGHLKMSRDLQLVEYSDETDRNPPYEPINPKTFRTGTVLFDGIKLTLDEPSKSFPDFYPTPNELAILLSGVITLQE